MSSEMVLRPSRLRMWGALLWEQWRIGRAALLPAFSVMFLYLAQAAWLDSPVDRYIFHDTDQAWGSTLFLWAPAIMAFLYIHIQPGVKDLHVAFPRRCFTLPIGTRQVLLMHFLFRMTIGFLLALPVAYMSWRQPDVYLTDLGPASAFLGYALLLLFGNTLGVLVAAHGIPGGLLATATLFFALFLELFLVTADNTTDTQALAILVAGLGVYAVFCTVVPWAVLTRLRHGEAAVLPVPRVTRDTATDTPQRPFASAFTAQVWFEWNQSMRFFAWPGLAIGVLSLFFFNFGGRGVGLIVGCNLTAALALGVGYLLVRATPAYLGFVAVRPQTNAHLGLAKTAAAFLAILPVFSALAFTALVMAGQRSTGYSRVDPEELLATLGLVAALIWTCLVAGRIVVLLYAVAFVIVFPHLWAFEAIKPYTHGRYLDGTLTGLCYSYALAVTAGVVGCVGAWLLHGRVPWARAAVAAVLTFLVGGLLMLEEVGINHAAAPGLPNNTPIHVYALGFLLVGMGIVCFAVIAAPRVRPWYLVGGLALTYAVALAHGAALHFADRGDWVDLEMMFVPYFAALVFLYYAAWKRELVPAGWGITAVGTWTLAALVWIALTPLGDSARPSQEGFMLPGFLALCAATPLWPPLALRLQRHR